MPEASKKSHLQDASDSGVMQATAGHLQDASDSGISSLQMYSIQGKNHFNLTNTGYDAAKMNFALQAGGRFDSNIRSKFWVTSDVQFKINLLNNAENSLEKLRIFYLSLNLGLRYEIGNSK